MKGVNRHLDISTTDLGIPLYALVMIMDDSMSSSPCLLMCLSRDHTVVVDGRVVFHKRIGGWR